MPKSKITQRAFVIVADGGRALVMRNEGSPDELRLSVVRKYGQDNPPTRDIGADKPGRTNESTHIRRSAMEPTDYHQQAEDRMMQEVAASLSDDLRRKEFDSLIIAAAPAALGVLRKAMSDEVRNTIAAEVPKDFTHFHLPEMGSALDKALKAA